MLPTRRSFRLGVLVLENGLLSSMAAASDMLRIAQKLSAIRDPLGGPVLESVLFNASGRTSVALPGGLHLGGMPTDPGRLDVLLIPGMMHGSPQDLLDLLATQGAEVELLRRLHGEGVRLAGTCSGTFLLAEAGLLDGRRATTTWWLSAAFRMRYPKVRLEESELLVDEGDVLTSGASCAMQNLMLRLIADAGGEALAQQAARMLLIDRDRQSQAPYVNNALIERPRHSLSERAEKFLQHELHEDVSVARLAEHCGTSERSLLRHFRRHYGVSPLAHIQHLRVERAKALLETSRLSFDEIVERCGYTDVSSFRRLFKRATSLTPGDYRERFRLRAN